MKAAQELQKLLLLAYAGNGASATPNVNTWQDICQELEAVVGRGHLSCSGCTSSCSLESFKSCESGRDMCLTQDGEASMERSSACSLRAGCVSRARSVLKMHVARKRLEVQLGVLPVPVQLSQQQAVQQQGCCVLPKLI